MTTQTFGDSVNEARKAAKLTQQGLADLMSDLTDTTISQQSVANWCRNHSLPADRATLLGLCMALYQAGGLQTLEEVNRVLLSAGSGALHSTEWEVWMPKLKRDATTFPPLPSDPPPSTALTTPSSVELADASTALVPASPPAWRWGWVTISLLVLSLVTTLAWANRGVLATREPRLRDANFEASSEVSPWLWRGTCTHEVQERAEYVRDGTYLAALNDQPDCQAFYQDVSFQPVQEQTYRFGVWVRAGGVETRNLSVEVLARGGVEEQSKTSFIIPGDTWYCAETALTLQRTDHTSLRFQVYLESADGMVYIFDEAMVRVGNEPLCPPAPPELEEVLGVQNSSFEEVTLSPWVLERCKSSIGSEPTIARTGSQYLTVNKATETCVSFHQDINKEPVVGETYHYTIWVRSSDSSYREGEIVIWGGQKPLSLRGVTEKGSQKFRIVGDRWHCVETTLTVRKPSTTGLRATVYLSSQDGIDYYFDDATFSIFDQYRCPDAPTPTLVNGSFEATQEYAKLPWQPTDCDLLVRRDPRGAYNEQQYLSIARLQEAATCNSFFQDIPLRPLRGETYNFSVWVRSADGSPRTGEVVIWAQGGQEQKMGTVFLAEGTEWQCVETSLFVESEGHSNLRPEVYLHANDTTPYYFDAAAFAIGTTQTCPEAKVQITHHSIWGPDTASAAGTIGLEVRVQNSGGIVTLPSRVVSWIASAPDGSPLDPTLVVERPLPTLQPQEKSLPIYANIMLPHLVETGPYYVVTQVVLGNEAAGASEQDTMQTATQIDVLSCSTEDRYCDVPADHWAFHDIMAFAEASYSTGCRSATTEYRDRPFCPEQFLTRYAVAAFFLKYLKEPTYRPIDRLYKGYYADVSAHSDWALWVEELYEFGFYLPSARCAPSVERPNFCLEETVTRGELALYLSQLLQWQLTPTTGQVFVDVEDDSQIARAIEYMAKQGWLPTNDPDCPEVPAGPRFCPDLPARRAHATIFLGRAFGLPPATQLP